jgi:hypothetical protein
MKTPPAVGFPSFISLITYYLYVDQKAYSFYSLTLRTACNIPVNPCDVVVLCVA